VDDSEIRIVGRKDVLERAILANGVPVPGVRSFVRKWRTRQDRFVRQNLHIFQLFIAKHVFGVRGQCTTG
jgi:hypothetical protein